MAEYAVRSGYLYTTGDTWAHQEDDGTVLFGITDYAQKKLKEIEYLNLPDVEEHVEQNDSYGEVESKKSVSEMMAPFSGTIQAINDEAVDDPALLNRQPYDAWIMRVVCENFAGQVAALMDSEAYLAYIEKRK